MIGYKANKDNAKLIERYEADKLKRVADKYFSLEQTAAAFSYFAEGCFNEKIVVTIEHT